MRHVNFIILGVFGMFFGLSTADAKDYATAEKLYNKGQWKEAAGILVKLNTSKSYALAARCYAMGGESMAQDQRKATYEKAVAYAKKSIALNAKNADGYFELGRAQGLLAKFSGVVNSLNLAKDVKKNFDKAIALNPKSADAYAGLGAWHANLVSKGFAAKLATGADRNQIVPNFRKAFALEPKSAVFRVELAQALLMLGDKTNAKKQIQVATKLNFESVWHKRSYQRVLAALK